MPNKEFQVRHGLVVNSNVLVANTVTGNVGIGISSPAYKLDVSGNVNITGTYHVNGTPISTGGGSMDYAYVNTSTSSANNYAGFMANSGNSYSLATYATIVNAAAAFAKANAALANTSGITFAGDLNFTGNTKATDYLFNNSDSYFDTSNNATDSWAYKSFFSTATQDTEPRDLFLGNNGTSMYVVGNIGDRIYQYNLSTPWDVTSATSISNFSVSSQTTIPLGLFFNPDGTILYTCGGTTTGIYQYNLSVAWDITTATYASKSFTGVTSQDTSPNSIWFKTDGTKLYVLGDTNDRVFQYSLSTPWDISTASYDTKFATITPAETVVQGICISPDGTKFWIVGSTYNKIIEYTMSVAWDVSTATLTDWCDIGLLERYTISGASGIYVDLANNNVYVSDYGNDGVFQLSTNTAPIRALGTKVVANNDLFVKQNLLVDRNLTVSNGTFRVIGTSVLGAATISSTFTVSTATGTLSIGTSQTTGTLTLGGPGQTGTIAVGRSNSSQSLLIGESPVGSGNTKTINIGVGGLAGSNTRITIGNPNSAANITVLQRIDSNAAINASSLLVNNVPVIVDLAPANNYAGAMANSSNNYAGAMANSANGIAAATYATITNSAAAFAFANSVSINTTAAFAAANQAGVIANAAFAAGNNEFTFSNTIYAAVNSVFDVANAAYGNANSVAISANNYAGVMANAANVYAGTIVDANLITARAYTNTSTTAANNYAGVMANAANAIATATFGTITNTTAAFAAANQAGVVANNANTYGNSTYVKKAGDTITGDLVIQGNVTISGNTTYANTQTLLIGDAIITLNNDIPAAVAPSEDAGIEIKRGTLSNVSLLWNEGSDKWTFTNDGTNYRLIASNTDVEIANNYSGVMANSANAYSDSLLVTGRAYTNTSTSAANNFAGAMANSANSYAGFMANSANAYAGFMANSGNSWTQTIVDANLVTSRAYTNTSTSAANNFAGVMANSSNNYAGTMANSSNNWANTKLANTDGVVFEGTLNIKNNLYIGSNITNVTSIIFNTSTNRTPTNASEITWSQDDSTLHFNMDSPGNVVGHIGQDLFYYVKNQSGSTITKGQVVRFAGTLGASGRLLIAPAIADNSYPSKYIMGVAAASIANGDDGFIILQGKIRGIDTSMFNEGDILYLSSSTPGAFTNSMPTAPNNKITVAAVVKKDNTQGTIEVRVTLGSKLNEDELVELSSLTNGDVLVYTSANGRFENRVQLSLNAGSVNGLSANTIMDSANGYARVFANTVGVAANNFAGEMANSANAIAAATYATQTSLSTGLTSANNYAGVMANSANAIATATYATITTVATNATSANNFAGEMANSSNNYAGAMANAANAIASATYATQSSLSTGLTSANNYAGTMANSSNSWSNTKLSNGTVTLAGALTTTGQITANAQINITATGGDEGGEIQLQGTGTNTNWSLDAYQNTFRVFARSGTTVSNVNFFHSTGGTISLGVNRTDPGYTLDVAGTINASSVLVNGSPVGGSGGSMDYAYVNTSTASANNWANTKLANTSGVSFAGNLYFPTGNVGIGTSSPTSNLTVVGTANITSNLTIKALVANGSIGTTEQVLTSNGSSAYWANNIATIGYTIDGGGGVLDTGIAGAGIRVSFSCNINSVSVITKETGSVVIDIWKAAYANFPPVVANTITASAKPTITNGRTYEDTTLTDWTKTINAGDVLYFNVDSCSNITSCLITLNVNKRS